MGASSIFFEVDGKVSASELQKHFERQLDNERSENGHGQGYSGDFQTTAGLKVDGTVFETEEKASEYILANTEKWGKALAVKYKVRNAKIVEDAKARRLALKLKNARESLNVFQTVVDGARKTHATQLKTKPFHTCKACKSRFNTKFLSDWRVNCPVCATELLSSRFTIKLAKLDAKREAIRAEYQKHLDALELKIKSTGEQWLIGGWGAH